MRARLLHRPRPADDDGFAMVFVIVSMLVVTLFVTAGLAYAVNSQILSRHDQDYGAALAAAQSGVDDYISHLNRNDNYARLTPFNDCANTALRGPKVPANSCGWTSADAPGWQRVNNAAVTGTPEFHYDVDASTLDATGTIDVVSTGRVNKVSRSVEVSVNRGGSTQYLYYTDHEDGDPSNPLIYPNGMSNSCYPYWWGVSKDTPSGTTAARKSGGSGCQEITFIGGDVLDGAVHLNDTPLFTAVNGKLPEFKKGLEVSDPACKGAVSSTQSTWSKCDRNGTSANYDNIAPAYKDTLYLPDNSGAFASYPGCSYTGPTRIIFNVDGTMTVWSKQSSTTAACGGNAPFGVRVQVPVDKVIYVKSATSGIHRCAGGEIDGTLPLGDWAGTDTDMSYSYDDGMLPPSQYCGQGNAYLQGTLAGRVTVATQNSITLTGDLKLAGGLNGNDLLGLVAGNSVEVFHPVMTKYTCAATAVRGTAPNAVTYCTKYSDGGNNDEVAGWPVRIDPTAAKGLEIDASIQTLAHSFLVQNYSEGSFQGTLSVRGSLAQKWRGIVGQGSPPSTGYLKDYKYDLRLTYSAPPYFPQFVNSVWGARHSGEVPPQY